MEANKIRNYLDVPMSQPHGWRLVGLIFFIIK